MKSSSVIVNSKLGTLAASLCAAAFAPMAVWASAYEQGMTPEIVLMAGIFDPKETRTEWNIHLDIPAAQAVAELSPVPIAWLPSETGANDITGGPVLKAYGEENPLGLAFSLFPGVIKRGGRSSWDPASALYAVEGAGDFFEKSTAGTVTVDCNGKTVFVPDQAGRHVILHLQDGAEQALAAYIDRRAIRLCDMVRDQKALSL
jgi:inosine-uridine nucleoside N-ribohydrolase